MKLYIAISVLFMLSCWGAFVNDQNTVRAVEKQGYTNVQIIKKNILFVDWCGCAKGDDAEYDMGATNALGNRVDLIVCAGVLKGVTVRTK